MSDPVVHDNDVETAPDAGQFVIGVAAVAAAFAGRHTARTPRTPGSFARRRGEHRAEPAPDGQDAEETRGAALPEIGALPEIRAADGPGRS